MTLIPFSFRAELHTSDPDVLVALFRTEAPVPGAGYSLREGVTASIDDVQIDHGLIETSIVVNFMVSVATGVTTKVIGDLLSEILKRRKAKLTVNGKGVDAENGSAIATAIEVPSDAG